MIKTISMEQVVRNLKTSEFFLNCKIPLGYSSGFPILQVKNGSLCVTIPYLKYQTTGEIDKTLVFPLRYGISLELPAEKIIGFENYEFKSDFANIDFDKPVGYFRHEAIKQYKKMQYKNLRRELMKEYDKAANALLGNRIYGFHDENRMSELLQLLIEPSLLPLYRTIDIDFYNKYLAKKMSYVKPPRAEGAVSAIMSDSGKLLKESGLADMAKELEKIRHSAIHERFTIAVAGEFSKGKSSFINHLLERDFLPVGNLPTTVAMTRIRYNPTEVMHVFDENNKKKFDRKLSEDSWNDLVIQNFGGEDFRGWVLTGINSKWLKENNIEIIDTPGAGDLSESRAKDIGDMLLGCDGAIITISAAAALSLTEKLFIEERLLTRKITFLLLIVTKLDLIPVKERTGVIRYIKSKLKSWGMEIPVYIPYSVEMDSTEFDDIIGMDKVKQKIEQWVLYPDRVRLTETWMLEKTANFLEHGISALSEKKLLLDEADQEKRNILIQEKNQKLAQTKLIWGELRLQMQKKCTDCYRLLLSKEDEYAETIKERLQYEAAHTNNPKKWWNEDFPYRVKIELTNMSVSVENCVSKQIEADVQWYSSCIEKAFQSCVMYERKMISDKELFRNVDIGGNIEFADLDKQRNAFRIGMAVLSISGFALFSALGFLPIVASIGIGTGSSIASEEIFRKKVEDQREELKKEIGRCVPGFIKASMAESEKRLENVYGQIILEAEKIEQTWLETQKAVIEESSISDEGDQAADVKIMIEKLQHQKRNIYTMLYEEK